MVRALQCQPWHKFCQSEAFFDQPSGLQSPGLRFQGQVPDLWEPILWNPPQPTPLALPTLERTSNPEEHFKVVVHAQLCLTLCGPMGYSPLVSSVPGISQARILEWIAISSSRRSSSPRDQTCVSCIFCIGRQILYHCISRLLLFSSQVMSNSFQPHGLQHFRLPCPSPSPRVCRSSCPLKQ